MFRRNFFSEGNRARSSVYCWRSCARAFKFVQSCSVGLQDWGVRACSGLDGLVRAWTSLFGLGRGLANAGGRSGGEWKVFRRIFFPAEEKVRRSSVLREILRLGWKVVEDLAMVLPVWNRPRGESRRQTDGSERGWWIRDAGIAGSFLDCTSAYKCTVRSARCQAVDRDPQWLGAAGNLSWTDSRLGRALRNPHFRHSRLDLESRSEFGLSGRARFQLSLE